MNKINNNSLRISDVSKEVIVYGFVSNKRKLGEITFIDLRDFSGSVQLVFSRLELAIPKESVLKVIGKVVERKDKNPNLPTGDIEIKVIEFKILSTSKQELPFVIRDDHDANEELKFSYRYLDLRREKNKQIFITRHKVVKTIRDFLDDQSFLEIETPILSKSTPEGARDFIVPTRKGGKFFALPQSPQLYKQLLMISGFEKYFQIARVFRDEDSRKDRQPEFTQLDIETAFSSEAEIQSLVEKMFVAIFKKLKIQNKISIPFQRMDYDDAMNRYGSDKPDLRFGNEIQDVKKYFSKTSFNIIKNAKAVKAIYYEKVISNKNMKLLEDVAKRNGVNGLAFASLSGGELKGPGEKFFKEESLKIFADNKANEGTLLFAADKNQNVNTALGAVRNKLNDLYLLATDDYEFVWIENWPLFEFSKEEKRYIATHHPFTAPQSHFKDNFDKEPVEARARAYDLVLNGYEIGGGSVRINHKKQQIKMLRTLGFDEKRINSEFGFFLKAFDYGVPPHLGIAFGIDRIVMILENTDSIRDVIAFPKNSHGFALMENAPSFIENSQLEEYKIKLKE